jgi:hypothetical protein
MRIRDHQLHAAHAAPGSSERLTRRSPLPTGRWIGGVSTRRVDDLVQAMGLSGISKSQVSKLCKEIDERVHAFHDQSLNLLE